MSQAYILEAEELSKSYSGFKALDGVTVRVRRGAVHCLIGPNGAGKTTFFNLLTKFVRPTKGTIRFGGHDVTDLKPSVIARLGIVRSFQISSVFANLSVGENVKIALRRKLSSPYRLLHSAKEEQRISASVLDLLQRVGLEKWRDMRAGDLPYGNKRLLELATTLALEPQLILLDEPMAGVGHEDVPKIAALIRSLAPDSTVLMVEHNLKVVGDISDTITVFARGKVICEGDYETVSANPNVIETYVGAAHA